MTSPLPRCSFRSSFPFSLLDRFKEAQQVLIPAWQYHVKQSQTKHSTSDLEKLDNSRESLIKTLKKIPRETLENITI